MNRKPKPDSNYHTFKVPHQSITLMYHKVSPEQIPTDKKILVVIHGLLEHCMNYRPLIQGAVKKGYIVYAFDLRGHGRSTGKRGHIESFSDFFDDLKAFTRFVTKDSGVKKLTLFGHSMGGLIATYFTVAHPEKVEKLVLSSPAYGFYNKWAKFLIKPLKHLSDYLPEMYLSQIVPIKVLTHDSKMLTHIENDPLRQQKITAKFLHEFYLNVNASLALAANLTVPTYIFQAGNDKLVSVKKVKRFYAEINTTEKNFIEYPGLFHEILNEIDRASVQRDILSVM